MIFCESIYLAGCQDGDARTILNWPDDFIDSLRGRLLAVHSGLPLSSDDRTELILHGVLEPPGREPTRLGARVVDLTVREEWQKNDESMNAICKVVARQASSVLDVGCGTGWVMRSMDLGPLSRRVGIDVDSTAIALGARFSRHEKQDCYFRYCSAHRLPFADRQFDFVVCRNALTYMHQRTALREMCRVLNPGGHLFLRFENFWYDLLKLLRPKGARAFCFNARDFAWGLFHAATGAQPTSGGLFRPGRVFGTIRTLEKTLGQNACDLLRNESHSGGIRLMGRATQTTVLARKRETKIEPRS
jgi:SAM-dependent methyltransferase